MLWITKSKANKSQEEQIFLSSIPQPKNSTRGVNWKILPTKKRIKGPSTLLFNTIPLLLFLTLFSHFNTVYALGGRIILKREYVGSNVECGDLPLGNGDIYCKPTAQDKFQLGQFVKFAWNTQANPYSVQEKLDIYLYRDEGQKLIQEWKKYDNKNGFVSTQVDETWFPQYDSSLNNTYHFFYIVEPVDQPVNFNNAGPKFQIANLPPVITSSKTTISTTTQSSTASILNAQTQSLALPLAKSSNNHLSPAMIAIITTVGILLLIIIAGIAFIIVSRSRRINKRHQSLSNISTSSNTPMVSTIPFLLGKDRRKNRKRDPESPIEGSSIHSTTPLANKNSMSSLSQKLGTVAGGIGVTTTISTINTPLGTTPQPGQTPPHTIPFSSDGHQQLPAFDAAMISDAYRQGLRKPDWKANDEDEEFDADIDQLSEKERQRRREAKELMKKELAEEGRGLHSVQRRHTKLQVHKVEEEDTSEIGSSIASTAMGGGGGSGTSFNGP